MEEVKLTNFFNLREIREYFELTQKQMAAILHVSKRTIEGYEAGERKIPDHVFELLRYKVFELNFCLTKLHHKRQDDPFIEGLTRFL